MPLIDKFSKALKRERLAHGLTQAALAQRSGLHRVYIAKLEAGMERNPTLDALEKLAHALHIPASRLLE